MKSSKMKIAVNKVLAASCLLFACISMSAQKYNVVDKSIAVVGNELITIGNLEQEVQMMNAQNPGRSSGRNQRCEILEQMLESKIYLMQARVDSLTLNSDMVESSLSQRMDQVRTQLGGDEEVEKYFGKPMYKIRMEWHRQLEDMNLIQQEQQAIASKVPEITPYDVKAYIDTVSKDDLPIVPITYQLSQIVIYPDREAANMAVKEKLLSLRERILNGEKFSTLARIYSEDPGSARRGGELGMASKSLFWPVFSDAAMALKPGIISQIVETPDGFHIIEVLEKRGDMFNARHILMKPQYTEEDRTKAFHKLDSIRTEVMNNAVTFPLAARFYSEDNATKTNGGQMADPNTGSSYYVIDQLKPVEYSAIEDLKEGEISVPIESTDNDGRQNASHDYVDGKTCYKIIRVDKIIPAHTATVENDFSQLEGQVRYELQMKAIDAFLKDKIKTTYVTIDPMFSECEFERPLWSTKFAKE